MKKSNKVLSSAKRWGTLALAVIGALTMAITVRGDQLVYNLPHGTAGEWINEDDVNETPPADYTVNDNTQGDAKDGLYNQYFLDTEIQTVKIEIEENNLNYLLQNGDVEPTVMTTSVTIGDVTLGYCGLKTKGAYTLEHSYYDNMGSDRFSFTVNFGKYITKDAYGKKQTFFGCDKISFNNFFFDKTMMKEFFALKLMTEMGLPTPQYGLAKLYINDEYYGVYAMVESFDESILEQYYGVDNDELSSYITKPEGTNFIYEELLEDDSPLWENDEDTYADVEDILPTVMEWVRKLNNLSNGQDFDGNNIDVNSEEYISLLNEILDVDEVLRYFATHSWLCQTDNMFDGQKNFGLYVDEDGKAIIMPWDYDLSFGCYFPGTSEATANYDIDSMYRLANWGQNTNGMKASAQVYKEFPLFYVIFQNEQLMEQYHGYMKDCSKIAALGGTVEHTGKTYDPGYFNSFIETMEEDIIEAASEELADNVYYMNRTEQPHDVKQGLPNLAKIIAMRAVGVLVQVDGIDTIVTGAGCDLSTLGNGSRGDETNRGTVTMVNAQTGIFLTAEYAGGRSGRNIMLTVKTLESDHKDYTAIKKELGCTEDDSLIVYDINNSGKPEGDSTLTIPVSKLHMEHEGEVKFYLYNNGELTELDAEAEDNLYTMTVSTDGCIAVMQVGGNIPLSGGGLSGTVILIIVAAVAVVAIIVGIVMTKNKKNGKKKIPKDVETSEGIKATETTGETEETEIPENTDK